MSVNGSRISGAGMVESTGYGGFGGLPAAPLRGGLDMFS